MGQSVAMVVAVPQIGELSTTRVLLTSRSTDERIRVQRCAAVCNGRRMIVN